MLLRKLHFLLPVVCLFAGCRFFQSSDLQRSIRTLQTSPERASASSLEGIRHLLEERGVPYKVVHFRYDTGQTLLVPPVGNGVFNLRETPINLVPFRHTQRERVGIIYRDDTDRKHPWWYVDAKTPHPIWLPTDEVQQQVAFAIRRSVEILQIEEWSGKMRDSSSDSLTSAAESREMWNARFKRRHGTDYDPASAVDRAKMQQMQIK